MVMKRHDDQDNRDVNTFTDGVSQQSSEVKMNTYVTTLINTMSMCLDLTELGLP